MLPLRNILKRRRLLAVLGIAALLFGLAMLHPYPRQSLFGPTIRGRPWCVWEAEIRRQFNERPESVFDQMRHWLGVEREQTTLFDDPDMLPLVIALLDDPDAQMRASCLTAITVFPSLQDKSALPALRKRFQEDEFELRLTAGQAIWQIERDKEVLSVFLKLLNDGDPDKRSLAMREVASISVDAPDLYPQIVAHAKDTHPSVRFQVMYAMRHFGKKGVPILIDGMNDIDAGVRYSAILIVRNIGQDARDAVPALEARLADVDLRVVLSARSALRAVDRERYEHLKTTRKIE